MGQCSSTLSHPVWSPSALFNGINFNSSLIIVFCYLCLYNERKLKHCDLMEELYEVKIKWKEEEENNIHDAGEESSVISSDSSAPDDSDSSYHPPPQKKSKIKVVLKNYPIRGVRKSPAIKASTTSKRRQTPVKKVPNSKENVDLKMREHDPCITDSQRMVNYLTAKIQLKDLSTLPEVGDIIQTEETTPKSAATLSTTSKTVPKKTVKTITKPIVTASEIASESVKVPAEHKPQQPRQATAPKVKQVLKGHQQKDAKNKDANKNDAKNDKDGGDIGENGDNDNQEKLIGNLKQRHPYKACRKGSREMENFIQIKIGKKRLIFDNSMLPAIGEAINSKTNTYTIIEKLGNGYCGAVYLVKNKESKLLAMKAALKECNPGLKLDCKINTKATTIDSPHFCSLLDSGKKNGRFNFIILSPGEKNARQLMNEKQKLSVGTAVALAQQTLMALRDLHEMGYLHKDIKSENVLLSKNAEHQIVKLIDFGLSGKLPQFEKETLAVKESPVSVPYFIGNLKYASLAALKYQKQSRKDDLESLLYMVIEFFGGKLPWQNSTDICFITQCKERLHLRENDKFRNDLFVGMPQELHTCFRYIIAVDFCEIPDYSYLFKLFECILKTSKVPDKFFVDWDSSKSYSPPPYAKEYCKTMEENGPVYKLSQKRIHFNVICRGSTYNFSHLKNNGLAVFRCVNDDSDGKRCQGLIHVKNYDKDNITEGDTVNVSTFGKKHSCRHQV